MVGPTAVRNHPTYLRELAGLGGGSAHAEIGQHLRRGGLHLTVFKRRSLAMACRPKAAGLAQVVNRVRRRTSPTLLPAIVPPSNAGRLEHLWQRGMFVTGKPSIGAWRMIGSVSLTLRSRRSHLQYISVQGGNASVEFAGDRSGMFVRKPIVIARRVGDRGSGSGEKEL